MLPIFYAVNSFSSEFPFYSAARISDPPEIDGVLEDKCWENAYVTEPFVAIGGKAVDVKTTGMLCWDDKNLYVAFVCEEPMMNNIEERMERGQIKGFDESIEIFIDSNYDRSTYVQLRVGITGERESREGTALSPAIQAGWSAGIKKYADRWTMEAAIPFELLGGIRPGPDIIWGLNLNRQRIVDPQGDMWTCWSDTKGAFATPRRFGNLIFADYPLWLRYRYTVLTGRLMEEMADMIMRYPFAGRQLLPELPRLDGLWADFLLKVADLPSGKADGYAELMSKGESVVASYEELLTRLRMEVIKTEFR